MQNKKPAVLDEIQSLFKDLDKEVTTLISKYEGDIERAKKIQKNLLPKKFPDIEGLKIKHKYISGFKSGGDYFDVFEFKNSPFVGILMSDSTGYGVSSQFISTLMKHTTSFSTQFLKSTSDTVKSICEELQKTMKPTEDFSLFFGILDRRSLQLRYTGFGSVFCYIQAKNGKSTEIVRDQNTVKSDTKVNLQESVIELRPSDRLVLVTDGFTETDNQFLDLIKNYFKKDSFDLIEELNYRIKKKFEDEDDLADQDCSLVVIDLDATSIRVAK